MQSDLNWLSGGCEKGLGYKQGRQQKADVVFLFSLKKC